MHTHFLECKIISGNRAGEIELIPRITLYEKDSYPFVLSRHQFPVKLAFAITINKSQGQTFEYIGIDLRSEVFAHGQLYVALSRTRGYDRIKIILNPENKTGIVKNVVYKEVLE